MSKYPDYKYINVKIIAKSRNLRGEDIVTYELDYPRYLHSEVMTHRVFGRNAQSCLHGDSEIYFDLPGAVEKGKKQKYSLKLSELYRKWNTPYLRDKIANMNIRCLNEDTKEIIHTNIKEVMYSGQKDVYEIETEKGYVLKCSADHRIFTDKGWRTLKDMQLRQVPSGFAIEKDVYLACNGEEAYKNKGIDKSFYVGNKLACRFDKIKSVKYIGKVDVYDIEVVGPYHNFIADGVVVHNSRAVPVNKTLEVNSDWVKPVVWGKNKAGMSASEELSGEVLSEVQTVWNNAAESVLEASRRLSELGLHKQWSNRLTEPFSRIKVIVTATEWDNFFWLRDDEDAAQPEIVELAQRMKEVNENTPTVQLDVGMWHLPYVFQEFTAKGKQVFLDNNAKELDIKTALKISASCCAQVSYRKLDDSVEKAIQVYNRLFDGPKPHMSPTEHQAKVPPKYADFRTTGITHMDRSGNAWSGNLKNFVQYRQLLQK